MDRHGQEKYQDVEEVEVSLVQPECSPIAVLVLHDSIDGSDLQEREWQVRFTAPSKLRRIIKREKEFTMTPNATSQAAPYMTFQSSTFLEEKAPRRLLTTLCCRT